jgi:hypothetical protein
MEYTKKTEKPKPRPKPKLKHSLDQQEDNEPSVKVAETPRMLRKHPRVNYKLK